jgi:hypothetical protein
MKTKKRIWIDAAIFHVVLLATVLTLMVVAFRIQDREYARFMENRLIEQADRAAILKAANLAIFRQEVEQELDFRIELAKGVDLITFKPRLIELVPYSVYYFVSPWGRTEISREEYEMMENVLARHGQLSVAQYRDREGLINEQRHQ